MTVAEGMERIFIPSLSEGIPTLYSIRMKCTLLVPEYGLFAWRQRHRNSCPDVTPSVSKAKANADF